MSTPLKSSKLIKGSTGDWYHQTNRLVSADSLETKRDPIISDPLFGEEV